LLDWHAKHEHDVKNIIKKLKENFDIFLAFEIAKFWPS
jgi:hypothetical protein